MSVTGRPTTSRSASGSRGVPASSAWKRSSTPRRPSPSRLDAQAQQGRAASLFPGVVAGGGDRPALLDLDRDRLQPTWVIAVRICSATVSSEPAGEDHVRLGRLDLVEKRTRGIRVQTQRCASLGSGRQSGPAMLTRDSGRPTSRGRPSRSGRRSCRVGRAGRTGPSPGAAPSRRETRVDHLPPDAPGCTGTHR